MKARILVVDELGSLVGASGAMHAIYGLMRRVAGADAAVLLSGESGTGKELLARVLHEQSPRAFGPFVAVNCAANPSELEHALFGRAGGACSDVQSERVGLLERAGDGTLLLDEIGEMPLDMQPRLLRVLEQRPLHPVAGATRLLLRPRIIAATSRGPDGEVRAKRFREDLHARLELVQIDVPPLRARGRDVLLLADHFVRGFAAHSGKVVRGISSEAQRRLLGFDWPGNVRQLEDSMQHAVARTRSERIEVEDLPERMAQFCRTSAAADVDLTRTSILATERRSYAFFRSTARRGRDAGRRRGARLI
jgi:DNA-binding NtrC family response regulator